MAGYNWTAGKSNNAVAAEDEGLVTRSKITREWLTAAGIDEKPAFIKWLAACELIAYTEWHHTSKVFNRTRYYAAADIADDLALHAEAGRLDILRAMHAEGIKADAMVVRDEMIARMRATY